MNSLRSPRNDAAVSVEAALGTRALRKLVAAARNPRFGAKPGSAAGDEAAPEYELLLPQ